MHERERTRRQNESTVQSDHIRRTWVFPELSALDEDYLLFLASTRSHSLKSCLENSYATVSFVVVEKPYLTTNNGSYTTAYRNKNNISGVNETQIIVKESNSSFSIRTPTSPEKPNIIPRDLCEVWRLGR